MSRFCLLFFFFLTTSAQANNCLWKNKVAYLAEKNKIHYLESKGGSFSSRECHIEAWLTLSDLYQSQNLAAKARQHAEQATELARETGADSPYLLAKALNQEANILLTNRAYPQALPRYQEALRYLPAREALSKANILTNLAQFWFDISVLNRADPRQKRRLCTSCSPRDFNDKTLQALLDALAATAPLSASEDKADNLLTLAGIAHRLDNKQRGALFRQALQALRQVREMDASLFASQVSYAYAELGKLYAENQNYSEALVLLRQAIFHAQKIQAVDLLFRWQYRLAKVYVTQDKWPEAEQAYQRAILHLEKIRPQLIKADKNKRFRDTEQARVYLDFITLSLQLARREINEEKRQNYLLQAIYHLENYKTIELQNYYQDDCLRQPAKNLDQEEACYSRPEQALFRKIRNEQAVLYPIFLDNSLEVLLYRRGKIYLSNSIELATAKPIIKKLIDELRMEQGSLIDLKRDSSQLYQWLIAPFARSLQGVETLVVVPDGSLYSIPFSALYIEDEQRYVLERYAVTVTPSLTLARDEKKKAIARLFLNGLSKPVAGFSPLPNVRHEIDFLQSLAEHHTLYDDEFTVANFRRDAQRGARAVHIATHGVFKGDVRKSFLQTAEKRLSADDLELLSAHHKARGEAVELLTLSACESAKGNERAALGLSGIAIKAGVRTAAASLWKVEDASTCYLMGRFYQLLLQENLSPAQALRKAQLELLHNKIKPTPCRINQASYSHPYYWGAFIIIGGLY